MERNDTQQIMNAVRLADRMLEDAALPSYSEIWTTNAGLRTELDQVNERLRMVQVELAKLRGDHVQTEMIVRTAASVGQVKRQLDRLKTEQQALASLHHERFERRWGASGASGLGG